MKNFHYRFLGNCESCRVETWHTHGLCGLMYCVYQKQGQGPIYLLELHPLIVFTILPLMKNFCHTFLKNYKGFKVETWYTHGQWADVLCVSKSGPRAHKSLDRFYNLPKMKNFHDRFLMSYESSKVETWYTHGQ